MHARLLLAAICLALSACGGKDASIAASPVGTWRVENVAESIADVHAESVRAMSEFLTAPGPGALARDRETGLRAARELDDAMTDRLGRARVTLAADGTFAWTPAPLVFDPERDKEFPGVRMDGRWSLAEGRLALDVAQFDGKAWPLSPLRFLGAFDGNVIRLTDLSSVPRSNKGLQTLVLRRVP